MLIVANEFFVNNFCVWAYFPKTQQIYIQQHKYLTVDTKHLTNTTAGIKSKYVPDKRLIPKRLDHKKGGHGHPLQVFCPAKYLTLSVFGFFCQKRISELPLSACQQPYHLL